LAYTLLKENASWSLILVCFLGPWNAFELNKRLGVFLNTIVLMIKKSNKLAVPFTKSSIVMAWILYGNSWELFLVLEVS
jgi:hypothetical protein